MRLHQPERRDRARVTDPTLTTLADGRVQITLDNVSNWFLRWLGLWVQFLIRTDVVIQASSFPSTRIPAEPGPYPPQPMDKSDAIFLGAVSPASPSLGIPVYPGKFSPTINIPSDRGDDAHSVHGLGLSGSIPQDPTGSMTPAF